MTILPLEVTHPSGRLFRDPLWWIGISISGGISLLSTLHMFFPATPVVPVVLGIEELVANNPPWDVIRGAVLYWSPWWLGLCYLMPLDFALSLIVFNLFWKAEYMFCRLGGWLISPWGGFPYGDQQNVGAYLAVMASVAWLDRRHLLQVLRRALGLPSTLDDSKEGASYRVALIGLVLGTAYLWWVYRSGGMSVPIATAFLLLHFVMVMAIVRMRAQIGPPSHWMNSTMPNSVLTEFPGTRSIGSRALGMMAMLRPFMGEQNANPAPIQLEALRIAERGPMRARPLALILLLAVPLTMISYFWANIHIGYQFGLGAKAPADLLSITNDATTRLATWLQNPSGPNTGGIIAFGIGAAIAFILMFLKLRLTSFPLHPMAFPLAFSWSIDALLPAIFLTWAAKATLLRYGGLRGHQRALPLFLGFIVGDATMNLIGVVLAHAVLGQ
jgi:hypothetical protein